MKLLNRLVPILSFLVILVSLEALLVFPKQVYFSLALIIVTIFLSLFQLLGRELKKAFWQLLPTPLFLAISGFLFFIFLENNILQQICIGVLVVLIWAFFEVVYLKFNFRPRYQVHSLENIISHLNLMTIFLSAAGLYSLLIFLNLPLWLLIVAFGLINVGITYGLIWSGGVILPVGWPYMFVVTLIETELFWAVSFLPTSIYVNGLILTLSYYLMSGLVRNWLLGIKEFKVVRRYLLISLICLAIILFTAKWF